MKCVAFQVDARHLCLAHFTSRWVSAAVQSAGDFQSLRRGCSGDEMDDRFVVPHRLTAPIRRDEGKQPVLDLVPFAGAGRKMTHRNAQSCLIGKVLQFQFPQPQPPPVASAPIGRDQNRLRIRINTSALKRHQPRMEATAKAPVSWSVPTLTKPALRPMS